jgi:hypothetical protein
MPGFGLKLFEAILKSYKRKEKIRKRKKKRTKK